MKKTTIHKTAFFLLIFLCTSGWSADVRIKDVARVEMERSNPLLGYGLVVGLNGTGDDATKKETAKAIQSYFAILSKQGQGLPIDPRTVEPKNSALVIVTGELPAYVRAGSRIDVTINSQFDATSLQGGTLLPTSLQGLDGKVYAIAQGPIAIGGFGKATGGGGQQARNHPTVGVISGGAIVERNVNTLRSFDRERLYEGTVNLILKNPDFTEAMNIQKTINESFGLVNAARALDPGTIEVDLKLLSQRYAYDSVMELIGEIEGLMLKTDMPARVVVNERTGVVIAGAEAKLSAVDIVQGDLRIMIKPSEPEQYYEDTGRADITETGGQIEPNPQNQGRGRFQYTGPRAGEATIQEGDPTLVQLKEGDTVGNLIQAISGPLAEKSPRDIISILQALERMGALHAQLLFVGS